MFKGSSNTIDNISNINMYSKKGEKVPCRIELVRDDGGVSYGGGLFFIEAYLNALEVGNYGEFTVVQGFNILQYRHRTNKDVWGKLYEKVKHEITDPTFDYYRNKIW